ncbi:MULTISPECIES: YraN family protein [Eubacterium]|uniref:UPF0102 protein SAMN04488579_1195 n=1 Tax=Eubacterium barkeri TaxID=1528 RepID=A0A1H3HRA9_EUBBA|nr:YraN family protein [Eubacterium barkeri]SDY18066.1 putative endonuclease [Eubacterium barkeri]
MSKKANKKKGDWGECQALDILIGKGHCLLAKNYRCKMGEVDLITRLGDTIVFTEVKYRSGLTYGTPGQAVDYRKQRHIIKTALHYIKQKHLFQENVRFDVIELLDSKDGLIANHIENAFLMAF